MIVPVWLSHENAPDDEILTYALLDTERYLIYTRRNYIESQSSWESCKVESVYYDVRTIGC